MSLGSILLDQKKNLDEAEKCVQKAIDLTKQDGAKINDIRMQITLARVQIAKGDRARARGTLRSIMSHQKELSKYEYGEFERLLKLANEKNDQVPQIADGFGIRPFCGDCRSRGYRSACHPHGWQIAFALARRTFLRVQKGVAGRHSLF